MEEERIGKAGLFIRTTFLPLIHNLACGPSLPSGEDSPLSQEIDIRDEALSLLSNPKPFILFVQYTGCV